jgi:hypothetical protein
VEHYLPSASYSLTVEEKKTFCQCLRRVRVHTDFFVRYFFNTVSQKVIGRKELDDLKAYMIETMCMLEMCFPLSFFICKNT